MAVTVSQGILGSIGICVGAAIEYTVASAVVGMNVRLSKKASELASEREAVKDSSNPLERKSPKQVRTVSVVPTRVDRTSHEDYYSTALLLTYAKIAEVCVMLFFHEGNAYASGLHIGVIGASLLQSAALLREIVNEKDIFTLPYLVSFSAGGVVSALSFLALSPIPSLILGNFTLYSLFKVMTKNNDKLDHIDMKSLWTFSQRMTYMTKKLNIHSLIMRAFETEAARKERKEWTEIIETWKKHGSKPEYTWCFSEQLDYKMFSKWKEILQNDP